MALLEGYLCEPGTVPAVRVLELNEAAREHGAHFSQYIEDRQGDGGEFESIRDWTSKLAGAGGAYRCAAGAGTCRPGC